MQSSKGVRVTFLSLCSHSHLCLLLHGSYTIYIPSMFIPKRVYHKLEQWFLIDVGVVGMGPMHFGKHSPCCSLGTSHLPSPSTPPFFFWKLILMSKVLENRKLYLIYHCIPVLNIFVASMPLRQAINVPCRKVKLGVWR